MRVLPTEGGANKTMNQFADSTSLYIRTGRESCNKFLGKFLNLSIRPFVLRMTGGCLIDPEYLRGLKHLEWALTGRGRKNLPQFAGFCLFGGTRMVHKAEPENFVSGITEVVPPLNRYCPRAQTLGVIAKVGDLKYSRHGIVVSPPGSDSDPYATIVHPQQDSVLIVQPSADHFASWTDEARECIDIIDHLRGNHWQGLLLAYNGGSVVGEEIEAWATLGKSNPFWRVLLVKGSGRTADRLAQDEAFLKEHPTVHVCENSESAIRLALLRLGALVDSNKVPLRS